MLLAVIISSTDAAATFSILRRQSLPPKLSSILEIESAANDPMAILLTMAAIQALTAGEARWYGIAAAFVWKFFAGIGFGWILGHAAIWLFNRLKPQDRGHYYVLSLGVVMLIYGLADLGRSSAMLAVSVAGYIMGNRPFVHKQGVTNCFRPFDHLRHRHVRSDGSLVYPRQWSACGWKASRLFRCWPWCPGRRGMAGHAGHEVEPEAPPVHFVGPAWAVPIILATYPMAPAWKSGGKFNLVFLRSSCRWRSGSTLGLVARWPAASWSRPQPLYNLELVTMAKATWT